MSIWPPCFAVLGPGGVSEPHAHHALHLLIALEGRLVVEIGGREEKAAGVITAPNVPHAIDASGTQVLILFVEPESTDGASLQSILQNGFQLLEAPSRARLLEGLDKAPGRDALESWAQRALDLLLGQRSTPSMHPKVRRLLKQLHEQPQMETSLQALADGADLSPSRLMHVFTESVGVPLRPYLLWLKVQRAAASIVGGASLTQAAADAEFSDAAHLSRTFKKMFGLTPSTLQKRSRAYQDVGG